MQWNRYIMIYLTILLLFNIHAVSNYFVIINIFVHKTLNS